MSDNKSRAEAFLKKQMGRRGCTPTSWDYASLTALLDAKDEQWAEEKRRNDTLEAIREMALEAQRKQILAEARVRELEETLTAAHKLAQERGESMIALRNRVRELEAEVERLRGQKHALAEKRAELTEAVGRAATALYRFGHGDEARKLDMLLLGNRYIRPTTEGSAATPVGWTLLEGQIETSYPAPAPQGKEPR